MIQLDIVAFFGATGLMLGLFGYLQRRQLTLEAGDTWEGIWATVVRNGLQRLHQTSRASSATGGPTCSCSTTPATPSTPRSASSPRPWPRATAWSPTSPWPGPGPSPARPARPPPSPRRRALGVFDARIVTTTPLETVATICQHHGFSGVPPNTALLPWRHHTGEPDAFLRALNAAADRGLNLLLFDEPRGTERNAQRRIDVWWAPEAGNLALSVALIRFITRASEWERARTQVLIVGDGGDGDELLRAKATRFLDDKRLDARVRVVVRPRGEGMHDLVCNESRPADLVLVGLPDDLAAADMRQPRPARAGRGAARRRRLPPGQRRVPRRPGRAPRRPRAPPTSDAAAVAGARRRPTAPRRCPCPSHPELAETATRIAEHSRAQLGRDPRPGRRRAGALPDPVRDRARPRRAPRRPDDRRGQGAQPGAPAQAGQPRDQRVPGRRRPRPRRGRGRRGRRPGGAARRRAPRPRRARRRAARGRRPR